MKRVRCAIYTRKSSDEGLDQSFNSLDAQREACEAYIRSQKHEGWKVLPALYDDGGASGGNMDREALQRLLIEIDEGRVDMVVVYKIDRLTRSLADFAKLVDRLDAAGASFVSVTQQFNTSTSMGRLTLNVLLSFAQFEREVTAERIRDKIAASKKKGLWMGGLVPLGYDKQDDGLVINRAEAETVRSLFQAYVRLGNVRKLKKHADDLGYSTKTRTLTSGRVVEGKSFTRGRLYHLLSNPIYRGKIRHKTELYEGVHDAIIDEKLWASVEAKLSQNRVARKSRCNVGNPSPLAGLVFDGSGQPLTPSHSNKKGQRYRYYVSRDRLVRFPATELESGVASALEADRNLLLHLQQTGQAKIDRFELVQRVTVRDGALDIEVTAGGTAMTISSGFTTRKRGVENKLVLDSEMARAPDSALITRILRAMLWLDQIKLGKSISEIAEAENVTTEYIIHNLDLSYLSPRILKAVVSGKQRSDVSAYQLSKIRIPVEWNDQTELFLEPN
jgi:DNA invertase Pin-like site-specific DNA recombinase